MKSLLPACFLLLVTACSCQSSNPAENQVFISDNNGVKTHGEAFGLGKYTVLFVHGWNIDRHYWDEQVKVLKSDFRVVTLDLPGFGQSGKNRTSWSIAEYAADINAVIANQELKNVILVGHSMAGEIVLEAALENKEVLAIVGIDNFKDVVEVFSDEMKTELAGLFELLDREYTTTISFFTEANLFHRSTSESVRARVTGDFLRVDSVIASKALGGLFRYAQTEYHKLTELKQPLFLINSNATPTDTSILNKSGVNYRLLEIDSTGHYPMIEKPAAFNALLREAFREIVEK